MYGADDAFEEVGANAAGGGQGAVSAVSIGSSELRPNRMYPGYHFPEAWNDNPMKGWLRMNEAAGMRDDEALRV